MQIWLKYLELIKIAPKNLCKQLREIYNQKIKEKYKICLDNIFLKKYIRWAESIFSTKIKTPDLTSYLENPSGQNNTSIAKILRKKYNYQSEPLNVDFKIRVFP